MKEQMIERTESSAVQQQRHQNENENGNNVNYFCTCLHALKSRNKNPHVCVYYYENSMPLQFYNTCTQMEWMKKESFVGFENKL